jgi:SAM-dependent methyltransferase
LFDPAASPGGWLAGRWRYAHRTGSGTGGRSLCWTCNLKTTSWKSASALDSRSASWLAATDGFVLGIDHSEVMVRQAAVRNRAAVEQGRVDLRLGSALDLRDFSEMFDKALAVNNFGMWPEPEARLKDLRGALRPGGRVAIVSQPRCLGASAETTECVGEETAGRLRDAGFISLQRETLNLRPPVACVLAEAPE